MDAVGATSAPALPFDATGLLAGFFLAEGLATSPALTGTGRDDTSLPEALQGHSMLAARRHADANRTECGERPFASGRLCAHHGSDDPFYKARYGAQVWALERTKYVKGYAPGAETYFEPDHWLGQDSELPIADAKLIVIETGLETDSAYQSGGPEGTLLLKGRARARSCDCDVIRRPHSVNKQLPSYQATN